MQAVLPLRRRALADRRSRPAAAAARAARTGATTSGGISTTSDIISMPDKWEYPWYAAWDLAFHCIPLALVDPDFAKGQLDLLLREWYLHPNGQIPAYEWAFGDVNPPVLAWAAWRVYKIEQRAARQGRPRLPGARLPQAAAQLHLVGQPQGLRGQERLPGRLPGAGQHRRLRPQRATADRRPPRAERRHQLDGHVLPEHDDDRPGTGAHQPRLRGHRHQVLRALPAYRRERDEQYRRRRHRTSGTRRTSSSTTCCACRTTITCR